jgi:hypothetical protein
MICPQQNNTIINKKNLRYVRNPKIAERSIDDSVFLVDCDTDIIFYLNPLSTGIWQLLRKPLSALDATNIVQQAFPDLPPDEIAGDVSRLISDMSEKNLVLNVD